MSQQLTREESDSLVVMLFCLWRETRVMVTARRIPAKILPNLLRTPVPPLSLSLSAVTLSTITINIASTTSHPLLTTAAATVATTTATVVEASATSTVAATATAAVASTAFSTTTTTTIATTTNINNSSSNSTISTTYAADAAVLPPLQLLHACQLSK